MITRSDKLTLSVDLAAGLINIDHEEFEPALDISRTMMRRHHRQVLDTKDKMVRDALICLGWTPPVAEAQQPDTLAGG